MTSHVWASRPEEYGLLRGMGSDVLTRDTDIVITAHIRNENGLPVSQGMCPKRMWIDEESELQMGFRATPLPDLFLGGGAYRTMSGKAADIFRKFDLGEGSLYPVTDGIYLSDNVTRIEEDFFCWIRGNIKDSFIQNLSRNVTPPSPNGLRYKTPDALNEDDLAISDRALEGPAVWMERRVWNCVFLAGDLGDELVKAGLKEAFALRRCRVVAGQR